MCPAGGLLCPKPLCPRGLPQRGQQLQVSVCPRWAAASVTDAFREVSGCCWLRGGRPELTSFLSEIFCRLNECCWLRTDPEPKHFDHAGDQRLRKSFPKVQTTAASTLTFKYYTKYNSMLFKIIKPSNGCSFSFQPEIFCSINQYNEINQKY